jgi:hypothetical protein
VESFKRQKTLLQALVAIVYAYFPSNRGVEYLLFIVVDAVSSFIFFSFSFSFYDFFTGFSQRAK